MDDTTALAYLRTGLAKIELNRPLWDRRERYYRGQQDLPYAPPGVNAEYMSLRSMSLANWLGLAMDAPIQRLRVDGFRTGRDGAADMVAWRDCWQANRMDARQRIPFTQMFVHGRGIVSVWPNTLNRSQPIIRPESSRRVHVEPDPFDPFTALYAVKTFHVEAPPASSLIVPASAQQTGTDVAYVYDATSWAKFEKPRALAETAVFGRGTWERVDGGGHQLGEVPFVTFDNRQDADGLPQSGIESLMPAQDAINTIRFLTLLAMQFSGYRQRVFTGYDPVVRDSSGNVVYLTDTNGTVLLDEQGQKRPMLNSPGRIGVDRALVFPGTDTKVFDMPESNLSNYIEVLGEFLTQLFAVGQVPPQYLLSRMANLSGDALTGAESTLASLVADLQRWTGESLELVMRLANRARGTNEADVASEVIWADAEARSFSQTIDAIVKLVSVEFPREAAFEMIPGATPEKVARWLRQRDSELNDALASQILRTVDRDLNAAAAGSPAELGF